MKTAVFGKSKRDVVRTRYLAGVKTGDTIPGYVYPTVEFPCAVAVVVLLKCFPVAVGIQSTLLFKRAARDGRLSPVQRATFLIL